MRPSLRQGTTLSLSGLFVHSVNKKLGGRLGGSVG